MAEEEPIEGIEEATAQLAVIEALAEAGIGISYVFPAGRNDGVSNEQIIKWLADGNSRSPKPIKRDIRANDEDAEKMGELFIKSVDKQLERVGKRKKSGEKVSKEDAARAGGASGLRAAAKYQAGVMYTRLEEQTDNNGRGFDLVGTAYAEQRLREYGINQDTVFFATGQLAEALLKGKYKLFFDISKVKKMLKVIDR